MNRLTAGIFLIAVMTATHAATAGRILSKNEVDPAASAALAGELAVFESVAQGIALSLAVCESERVCNPALSENELAKLIETLDDRIDQLSTVDESINTGSDYDSLLNEYRRTRETYALYMRELQDARRGVPEYAEEEIVKEPRIQEPAAPVAEKSARLAVPEEEPAPRPKFRNDDYSIEYFEDADELIRSE